MESRHDVGMDAPARPLTALREERARAVRLDPRAEPDDAPATAALARIAVVRRAVVVAR